MHINFYFSQIDGKKWKLIGETKNPLAESLREKNEEKKKKTGRFIIYRLSVSCKRSFKSKMDGRFSCWALLRNDRFMLVF